MEYIGKINIIEKLKKICFYLRSDNDNNKSIENENLLDLHGYLSNMVDWLKLV